MEFHLTTEFPLPLNLLWCFDDPDVPSHRQAWEEEPKLMQDIVGARCVVLVRHQWPRRFEHVPMCMAHADERLVCVFWRHGSMLVRSCIVDALIWIRVKCIKLTTIKPCHNHKKHHNSKRDKMHLFDSGRQHWQKCWAGFDVAKHPRGNGCDDAR